MFAGTEQLQMLNITGEVYFDETTLWTGVSCLPSFHHTTSQPNQSINQSIFVY